MKDEPPYRLEDRNSHTNTHTHDVAKLFQH